MPNPVEETTSLGRGVHTWKLYRSSSSGWPNTCAAIDKSKATTLGRASTTTRCTLAFPAPTDLTSQNTTEGRRRQLCRGPVPTPHRPAAAFLHVAYTGIGLAASHIEQLTSSPADQILYAPHDHGIPVRPASSFSPWYLRTYPPRNGGNPR